jgi:hypothetical protein
MNIRLVENSELSVGRILWTKKPNQKRRTGMSDPHEQ